MVRFVVKTVNAAYMCGFFTYYMLQHEWTVLQALTFQVQCCPLVRLVQRKLTI